MKKKEISVLVAEDDEDDYLFLKDNFKQLYPEINLIWVKNGEELTALLFGEDNLSLSFVILDLNMPKKDGRQALSEIRAHEHFKNLPVIVFTTSNSEKDRIYVDGFNDTSFVTKPIGVSKYADFVKAAVLKFVPELAE